MSYFARLRQHSGLAVGRAGASVDRIDAGAPADAPIASEAVMPETGLEAEEIVELSAADSHPRAAPPAPETTAAPRVEQRRSTGTMMPPRDALMAAAERPHQPQPSDLPVAPASRAPAAPESRMADATTEDPERAAAPDVVLRHVFQWLAAPAQPVPSDRVPPHERDDAERPHREPGRSAPSVRRADVPPPSRAFDEPPVRPAASPVVVEAESIDVERLDAPRDRRVQRGRDAAAPRVEEPPREPAVEEALTISIGAISVRVEAPAPAPPVAARPAPPAPAPRAAKRPVSRLARHYLHP